MWKYAVGFVAFSALVLWVMSKGGDIDMSGEKHGTETTHAPAVAASVPAAVSASAPAAVASAGASAAK